MFPTRERLLPGRSGLLWACAVVVLAGAVLEALRDQDLWWHLATGEVIAATRAIPALDPFAVGEAAKPWVIHEWLFELVLAGLHAAGGERLLVLLPPLGLAALAGLSAREASRRGAPATVGAPLLVLALLPTHEYWVQRPQLSTFVLLGWLLSDLGRFADGDGERRDVGGARSSWWIFRWVPLAVLWANLHAAAVLAPLAIAAHLAGAGLEALRDRAALGRVRRLALLLAAVLVAGLANPHGVGLYAHALGYTATGWHGIELSEWVPPDFRDPRRLLFGAVLLGALVLAALSRRARPGDLFAVLGFALMALKWQRHVPLPLIALAPLLPVWGAQALAELRGERAGAPSAGERVGTVLGVAHLLGLALLALLAVAARWPCSGTSCEDPRGFPAGAVRWLAAQGDPPGRLLNHYDWGGYLLHRRPGEGVFVDGRTCDIDLARIAAYSQLHGLADGWRERLDAEGIGWVLYPPAAALPTALIQAGWEERFRDERAVVLVRPAGQGGAMGPGEATNQ